MAQTSSGRQMNTPNVELKRFGSDIELANAAAVEWLSQLELSRTRSVALSGGRIAKTFFQLTATRGQKKLELFRNVEFFWADERCLEPTDPESNFYLADLHLLQPLQISSAKVHRLYGELDADTAVANAITTIARVVPSNGRNLPALDLVILGMGEDGHVASLFPNTPKEIASPQTPFVHFWNSPNPPLNRLSLSYAMLVAARDVWVLATGKGKEQALTESL